MSKINFNFTIILKIILLTGNTTTSTIQVQSINPILNVPIFPSVTKSGQLTDKLQFMSLEQYFLVPFKDNSIEMEVKFKIKTSPTSPLTVNDQKFKHMKEAAKQLGFKLIIDNQHVD